MFGKDKQERIWKGLPGLVDFLVPIGSLKQDPENTRKHSERNVSVVKTSLNDLGQHRLAVTLDDGTLQIGGAMLTAALDLGWTHLAAIRSGDKGVMARIRALTDNRSSDEIIGSAWSFPILADLLTEIDAGEFDLETIGWTEDEIEQIMTWTPEGKGGNPDEGEEGSGTGKASVTCPSCGEEFIPEKSP